MERCPQCNRMSAERNHNTGNLICNWKTCGHIEQTLPYCRVFEVDPCSVCPDCGYPYSEHRAAGMFKRHVTKICPPDSKDEPWNLGYWIKDENNSYIWEEVPVVGDKIVIPTEKFDKIVLHSISLFKGTRKKKPWTQNTEIPAVWKFG